MQTPEDPRPEWERKLLGRSGIFVALGWGLAEGTLFILVPDVFLSLVALLDLRSTWKHVLAAVCGALLAGALMFHWSQSAPAAAHSAVAHVPFIREPMFDTVDEGFRAHGLIAVFLGSVTGIPYKLYAVEAPKFCSALAFLLATPPARAARFILVWLAFGAAGQWLRKRRNFRTRSLVRIYAAVWIVIYALYWSRIILADPWPAG
jgi:membrane protein YqaA with SNARE-associated domain